MGAIALSGAHCPHTSEVRYFARSSLRLLRAQSISLSKMGARADTQGWMPGVQG